MNVKKVVSRIALSFLIALGAAQTAFAGLQIELVYIENPPQPGAPVVTGGGQLREIMKVAAENWERVFKHASGNWKLTVEYGWGNLHGQFYGKEFAISERGNNPPHIGHSCVLFNADATLDDPVKGFFADPTPSDNSEYLAYTADTINTDYGWLNVARTFSEPTGEAVNRVDMLMLAMHELGHALGLDADYSGLKKQWRGFGQFTITRPRPFAGFDYFLVNGPHIGDLPTPLMIANIPSGERRIIPAADALLLAQINLVDRPDLSEPPLDFNGDGRTIPTRSVSSSSSCPPGGPPRPTGVW
jgi:hypothetical protein